MELRKALEEITYSSEVSKHPNLITELNKKHPHSIELIEQAGATASPYNCFMYSLSVAGNKRVIGVLYANVNTSLKFGTKFIDYLVVHKQLVQADNGPVVIYHTGKAAQHAGLYVSASRVASKWGLGHLWEHDVLEVPSSYGTDLRRFAVKGDIAEAFETFAQTYN